MQLKLQQFLKGFLLCPDLRVMSRCNHAGGLDGDIKNSLTIVASFCSTFYGKSREDLLQELGEVFDGVLEIPLIMDTTSVKQHHALAAVLEHLEKILKEMNESSKGLGKRGRDAEEEGTDVNSIWEEEMRRLFASVSMQLWKFYF